MSTPQKQLAWRRELESVSEFRECDAVPRQLPMMDAAGTSTGLKFVHLETSTGLDAVNAACR